MFDKQGASTFASTFIVVLVGCLNELRWQDAFLDFIKGPLRQITAGEYAIKLSVLKLCLRDDFETDTF